MPIGGRAEAFRHMGRILEEREREAIKDGDDLSPELREVVRSFRRDLYGLETPEEAAERIVKKCIDDLKE